MCDQRQCMLRPRERKELSEDDVVECVLCERIADVEKSIGDAVAIDMCTRVRNGERVADFAVNSVIQCALERSRTADSVSMEDADDDVEDEIEATALRVAHDMLVAVKDRERRERAADNAYFIARTFAERYVLWTAAQRLGEPLIARFQAGIDMEAQVVRDAMVQARRERYRRSHSEVRETGERIAADRNSAPKNKN